MKIIYLRAVDMLWQSNITRPGFFLCKTIATGSVCGKNVDEKMKSNHWGKTRPFGLAPLPEAWSEFWGSRSQCGETDLPADASSAHSLFTRPIKIWQSFCNHWLSMKANSYFHSYSNNPHSTSLHVHFLSYDLWIMQ